MTGWIDAILMLMLAEAVALAAFRGRTGRGVPLGGLLPNLLAGAMLLGAMRVALVGGGAVWVALFLLGGLLCHIADLRARWVR